MIIACNTAAQANAAAKRAARLLPDYQRVALERMYDAATRVADSMSTHPAARPRLLFLTPSPTLPLRYPGHAHALIHTLTSGEVSGMVARHAGSVAAEGEGRIEHKAHLRGGPRLVW